MKKGNCRSKTNDKANPENNFKLPWLLFVQSKLRQNFIWKIKQMECSLIKIIKTQ